MRIPTVGILIPREFGKKPLVHFLDEEAFFYAMENDMLENKLGITVSSELARAEERISKQRALSLFDDGILDQWKAGSLASLKAIHAHLFGDIYPFAGQLRTVDLAKDSFRFAPSMFLDAALETIEKMPQSTFDEIAEKYVEMNIAHPFREGNGRSMRIWLNQMLQCALGQVIDWSQVGELPGD